MSRGASSPRDPARTQTCDQHFLRAPHGFAELYKDDPLAVEATEAIAARCTFSRVFGDTEAPSV